MTVRAAGRPPNQLLFLRRDTWRYVQGWHFKPAAFAHQRFHQYAIGRFSSVFQFQFRPASAKWSTIDLYQDICA
ncbi:hypothetical protein [Alicyclobacillus mengziensis]|uniref:Uncharacterized protein n=1 Tax=Alicyclobacillus mengziensis TaxID=2931921 RepID=A0A9X7W277_9BACL|nr:hypothetical protein [Alicyclobacillus mengziensis]QSO49408.1 hypothetical protein JZ786_11075 [Alicyclobacillus mengziensis]